MVAGGWNRNGTSSRLQMELDSVELLVVGQSAWQQSEPLPIPMRGLGAAVIDNVPYLFGNHSFIYQCFIKNPNLI